MLGKRTSAQQEEIDPKEHVANMNTARKITEMEEAGKEKGKGNAAKPGRIDANKAVVEEPEEMVEEPAEMETENKKKKDKLWRGLKRSNVVTLCRSYRLLVFHGEEDGSCPAEQPLTYWKTRDILSTPALRYVVITNNVNILSIFEL
jgi:hypothetical protein